MRQSGTLMKEKSIGPRGYVSFLSVFDFQERRDLSGRREGIIAPRISFFSACELMVPWQSLGMSIIQMEEILAITFPRDGCLLRSNLQAIANHAFNPHWHELWSQEIYSLASPRGLFYKSQWAWQGVKLTRLGKFSPSQSLESLDKNSADKI